MSELQQNRAEHLAESNREDREGYAKRDNMLFLCFQGSQDNQVLSLSPWQQGVEPSSHGCSLVWVHPSCDSRPLCSSSGLSGGLGVHSRDRGRETGKSREEKEEEGGREEGEREEEEEEGGGRKRRGREGEKEEGGGWMEGETGKRILLVFLLPVKVSDLKRILLSIPDQTVREMQLNIQKVRLRHTLVPRLQCWEYS